MDPLVVLLQGSDERDRDLGTVRFVDQHHSGAGLGDPGGGGLTRIDVSEKLERAAVTDARPNRCHDQRVVGYDDKAFHESSALPTP